MAKLPKPGLQDWGDVLNSFLLESHNPDGTLKASAVKVAGAYIKPATGIPESDLAAKPAAAPVAAQSLSSETSDCACFTYVGADMPEAPEAEPDPNITFTESFETGPDATALSTTNTAYTLILKGTSCTSAFTTDGYAGLGGKFYATGVTGSYSYASKTLSPAVSVLYTRRFYKVDATPTAATPILAAFGSGTKNGAVTMTSTGKFGLQNGSAGAATSTTSVPLNAYFRLEWTFSSTAGTQSLQIYTGANVNGTTPTETISAAFPTSVTTDALRDGIISNPGVVTNLTIDEAVNNSTTWVGPYSSTPPSTIPEGSTWLQLSPGGAITPQLTDGFESGDLTQWSFNTGATVGRSYAATGLYGARLSGSGAPASITWSSTKVSQNHAYASVRMRFRYIEKPPVGGTAEVLFEIINALTSGEKSQLTVLLDTDNKLKANMYWGDTLLIDDAMMVGVWHFIEVQTYYGSPYESTVRYDGKLIGTFNSTAPQGATTAASLQIGYPTTNVTHIIDVDDVAMWVGDTAGGFIDAMPPVIRYFHAGRWI